MRGLRSLSVRSLRERAGRSLLSGVSIVLGVAVFFGVAVGADTITRTFEDLTERLAGGVDVVGEPVGADNAPLPDGAEQRLRERPDVAYAVAIQEVFAGVAPTETDAQGAPFQPFGVSVIGTDAALGDVAGLEMGRLPAPDTPEVALRAPVEGLLGETVRLGGSAGTADVTVVGVLGRQGLGGIGSEVTALTNTRTVAAISGDHGARSRVVVALQDGIDRSSWLEAHGSSVPGLDLIDARDVVNTPLDFVAAIEGPLRAVSVMALVLGAYLIYLSFSATVAERSLMYGALRAIGAGRVQLMGLVLAEAAILGLVASGIGMVVGLAVASLVARALANFFDAAITGFIVSPGPVIAAFALGILAPVISVAVPARRAARVDPVAVLRGESHLRSRPRRTWIAGTSLLATGVILALAGMDPLSSVGTGLILWGAALLVPSLLAPVAERVRPLGRRLVPGVGDVAVQHVTKERSRSAYTAALLMVAMAMLLASAAAYVSQRPVLADVMERQWGADLQIWPPGGRRGEATAAFAERVRTFPGVAAVAPVHWGDTTVIEPVVDRRSLMVIDPVAHFEVAGFVWLHDATDAEVAESLATGGAVVLPEPTARELGVTPGSEVVLSTNRGAVPFRLVATYATFGAGNTFSVVVGLADGRKHFGVTQPQQLWAAVASGSDPETVRQAMSTEFGTEGVAIQTGAAQKQEALDRFNGIFGLYSVLLVVALAVAILGLANTMTMSVLSRVREIGVLRAIGLYRHEIRRMVVAESAVLGFVALVLGVALSGLLAWLVVRDAGVLFGVPIPLRYAWTAIPVAVVLSAVVATVAAITPARRAAKVDPVVALRFE